MDRSSILRASTNSFRQVEKCLYLLFYYLQIPRRIELCAGRGRKENAQALLARGRGRRKAAEAGADLRSKYADSPRNAPTQKRCAADGISANYAPASTDPPNRGESNSAQGAGVRKTPQQRRVGCVFPMTAQAESSSRNPRSDWDSFSRWRLKRKLRPGIRAQNGTRFPTGGPSGKRIPEPRLKLGRAFRSISSTPKPMRPPSQNWVEESQNAIAGGQYDCRR